MCSLVERWSSLRHALIALPIGLLVACGSGSDETPTPPTSPGPIVGGAEDPCQALSEATTPNFATLLQAFLDASCYQGWRHDAAVRTSNGVHPFVKVYYSPAMARWQDAGARDAEIPNGAMLVKEQYPTQAGTFNEWTVMVKDNAGSLDGWYWADMVPSSTALPALGRTVGFGDCAEPSYPAVGFGQYCLNCHASAVAGQNTFATTRFLTDTGGALGPDASQGVHSRLVHRKGSLLAPSDPNCMIPESLDHVTARPTGNGPPGFVTSDQCAGCHAATGTLSPTRTDLPAMLYPEATADQLVDLSINGEWRNSMMGLAGRDPIFFSQLNSEVSLHTKLSDQVDAKGFIEDTCLRCHGVMGQRQFHEDKMGLFFRRDELDDPKSKYGALARDGVSCTACHRIAAKDLGTQATYTGQFNVGPSTEIYGPFGGNSVFGERPPLTAPMVNALGMTPQFKDHIRSSALCGSCHLIKLPVYRADGTRQQDEQGQPKTIIEQSTFFEWLNSDFADNGPTPKSCQDCHMRKDYNGTPLFFKIANIEDSTFPAVDFRLPDADLQLPVRPYSRHLLAGINVFGLEIFKQFRTDLGLYKDNPMLRNPEKTTNGLDFALSQALDIARTRTATVSLGQPAKSSQGIFVDVTVTNQAGHGFPSGVSFRRAFLHLELIDAFGKTVWQSGDTDASGVIVDGDGKPLATEFFTPQQQQFQPHFWSANPITRQDQVQIYEELSVNPEGRLTTSFLALDHKVKDNRLQPKGHDPQGPNAQELAPVGVCRSDGVCDPFYSLGVGGSTVAYRVALDATTSTAAFARATLYYQAVPPYYLAQRASDATGRDTDRLQSYVRNLKVGGTAIENWKLRISSAQTPIVVLPTAAARR